MKEDVIIIGGGAAGLCAAVAIRQKAPGMSVRLLEALPRVGKKLAMTGNGRCNITNRHIRPERYHGRHPDFAAYALEKYDNAGCEAFFGAIGVPFVYEGEKAYPASFQAASVVDCLRFAVQESGVTVCTETKVTGIQLSGGGYKVITEKAAFYADRVILAAGLLSGGDSVGCDGSILQLMKAAGFKTVPLFPAIVQIKTETDVVRQLKGVKIEAGVRLCAGGKTLREDRGETLFCDYGLSGPPILQVSGALAGRNEPCTVCLDLAPDQSFEELLSALERRATHLQNRLLDEFFTGMLPKRIGQVLIKQASLGLHEPVSALREGDLRKLAALIKKWSFRVTGTTGFANSQVTAGGLDTTEFDPKTMMCKSSANLYAIGEILDIDGDCGGFNLRWAWSSALCAAEHIAAGGRYADFK